MLKRTIFSEEHDIFRDQFRKWLEAEAIPFHEEWEKAGQVPKEIWRKAGENGFLCPWAEEKYGGSEADFLFSVVMVEEIAKAQCSGLALSLHSDVVVPYIHAFSNEEQKDRWMPGLVDGSIISAIAMTEPGTGSDLAAIRTTAVEDGDDWVINGAKTFISNGLISDLVIVVANTNPKADNAHEALTLIVVEEGAPGFERGKKLEKIGMRAQDTSELFFNDCRVPKSNTLGEPGQAFYYLMQKLQQERLVVAIGSAAGLERTVEDTLAYTKERKVFGRPVAKFQNSRFKLVEAYTSATVVRVFVDRLIESHIAGENIVAETAMAKYWVSDQLCIHVDECLQLFGGYGYMREYPIARAYEDARVQRIYAGTNEIMKEIIGRFALGI